MFSSAPLISTLNGPPSPSPKPWLQSHHFCPSSYHSTTPSWGWLGNSWILHGSRDGADGRWPRMSVLVYPTQVSLGSPDVYVRFPWIQLEYTSFMAVMGVRGQQPMMTSTMFLWLVLLLLLETLDIVLRWSKDTSSPGGRGS